MGQVAGFLLAHSLDGAVLHLSHGGAVTSFFHHGHQLLRVYRGT